MATVALSGIITPSNVVTAASTTTLTNKTISGASNTLTNIPLSTGVTGTLPVTNGGTGSATLTANNVLLGNGTSALQVIAPSTSGNVLTSTGSTWASTAPNSGAMVLLATVNAAAATTLSSLSSFSGTYNSFMIVFSGIEAATATPRLRMNVAVGGTVVTGGTAMFRQLGVSMVSGVDFNASGDYVEITQATNSDNAGKTLSGFLYVFNANSTTAEKAIYGQTFYFNAGSGNRQSIASGGRFTTNASVISGISFFWDGGEDFRAIGNIKIYGILA